MKFIKNKYFYELEMSSNDKIEKQGNVLIWITPHSAGTLLKVFFQLDKNNNILKELKTFEKSLINNEEWRELDA